MNRIPIGLIHACSRREFQEISRLVVGSDNLVNMHKHVIEKYFPKTKVKNYFVEELQGVEYYDIKSWMKATTPRVNKLVHTLVDDGVDKDIDAVIISCCADPGLHEAQKILSIPVVGAGSAASTIALQYGERVGVLGERPLVGAPPIMQEVLGEHLVAVENPNIPIGFDLLKPETCENILEAAKKLAQQNVDIVVLGCTLYSSIPGEQPMARTLTRVLGIPVIDPVISAASIALALIYTQHR